MLESRSESQRRPVRIICTQPRRIAAITIAKRVAEELGEVVGEGVVGYKIHGVSVVSPRCKSFSALQVCYLGALPTRGRLACSQKSL